MTEEEKKVTLFFSALAYCMHPHKTEFSEEKKHPNEINTRTEHKGKNEIQMVWSNGNGQKWGFGKMGFLGSLRTSHDCLTKLVEFVKSEQIGGGEGEKLGNRPLGSVIISWVFCRRD